MGTWTMPPLSLLVFLKTIKVVPSFRGGFQVFLIFAVFGFESVHDLQGLEWMLKMLRREQHRQWMWSLIERPHHHPTPSKTKES